MSVKFLNQMYFHINSANLQICPERPGIQVSTSLLPAYIMA